MLYRALNAYDVKNWKEEQTIKANIVRSYKEYKNKKTAKAKNILNIFSEVYYQKMSLALDRIIAHVGGKNMKYSCWISTSKSFNFVAEEYAIPQTGKYNIDMSRKPIAIIDKEKTFGTVATRDEAGNENIAKHFGECVDISDDNLNRLYEAGVIYPLYQNEDACYSLNDAVKSINNKGKTKMTGFNNFAKAAYEVLFFTVINKENIISVISPLMQDILYVFTKDANTNEDKIVLEKLKEFINIDVDIHNYEKYDFTPQEINVIEFLYTQREDGLYNSLVDLIPYLYDESINIIELYEILKEIKKSILRKITGVEKIELLDNEIFVSDYDHCVSSTLFDGRKVNNRNKYDIIFFTDKQKKLTRVKPAV